MEKDPRVHKLSRFTPKCAMSQEVAKAHGTQLSVDKKVT